MGNVLLSARDLVVTLGGNTILRGVSFDLEQGEVLGFVGESGSGKTTLALSAVGLHDPASGTVRYMGSDVATFRGGEKRRFAREVHYLFQDPYDSLDPLQSVGAILREPLSIHGIRGEEADRRIDESLRRVGLPPDIVSVRPGKLSGGQRQRVAIARGLVLRPRVMILDEPVASLDVSIQAQVINLLQELIAEGGLSVIFIAHDLHLVHLFCDRTLVLYRGMTMEEGPVDTIFRAPSHPYTRLLLQSIPGGDPLAEPEGEDHSGTGGDGVDGCPFAPRCPRRDAACMAKPPDPAEREGVVVRCFHPL